MDEPLCAELLKMEHLDRSVGANLVERGELHTGDYYLEMQIIHQRHNARLRTIIETHGGPSRSLVRKDGCRATGFVVQHTILDLDLQRCGVALLREAVGRTIYVGSAHGLCLDAGRPATKPVNQ